MRASPTDTGMILTPEVTRPLEMDWTIWIKMSSFGKCIMGSLVIEYLQDKGAWHHRTRTNTRLSRVLWLIHIKSST